MTYIEENRAKAAEARLRDAESAVAELKAALGGAGIVLPSLWVDRLSYCDERLPPLVELGGCNVATVRALTAALAGPPTRARARPEPD